MKYCSPRAAVLITQSFLFASIVTILLGCVTARDRYRIQFNEAVQKGEGKGLVTSTSFEEIRDVVLLNLQDLGYEQRIAGDADQGFMVLRKNAGFIDKSFTSVAADRLIMTKFTKWENNHIRIDFINGSTNLPSRNEVERDLAQLLERLRGR